MPKSLLLSLLVSIVLLGTLGARDPNASRGLRRAVVFFVGFNLFFGIALQFAIPSSLLAKAADSRSR